MAENDYPSARSAEKSLKTLFVSNPDARLRPLALSQSSRALRRLGASGDRVQGPPSSRGGRPRWRPRGGPPDLRAKVRALPLSPGRRQARSGRPVPLRDPDRRRLALGRLRRGDREADSTGARPDAELPGQVDRRRDPPDRGLRAGADRGQEGSQTLTLRRIPIFPLPGVVLLPGTMLPLHIFEPRYRAMVADALAGERTIGMAMIKPGWESAGPTPDIHPIGGAGRIVEAEELPDGRYNIVLQGEFRYRVVSESPPAPYRVAEVEEIATIPFADAGEALKIS